MPAVENNLTTVTGRDGAVYNFDRLDSRALEVDVTLVSKDSANLAALKRKVAGMLYTAAPQPLIFSDDTGYYYMAKLTDITEIEQIMGVGQGTIKFICPDPLMYKVTQSAVNNTKNDTLLDSIAFTNPGTAGSAPVVDIEFQSESGFVSLINQEGRIVQVGNPDEVDGITEMAQSATVVNANFVKDAGWTLNKGVTPLGDAGVQTGTVKYQVDTFDPSAPVSQDEGFVNVSSYGTGTGWHGPSITTAIPQDINKEYPVNWKASFRIDFNNGVKNNYPERVGHQSTSLVTEDGKVLAALVVEDSEVSQHLITIKLYVDGKMVWNAADTSLRSICQRGTVEHTTCYIEKLGSEITFSASFAGIQQTFRTTTPEKEIRSVTWYCAQYGTNSPMINNLIRVFSLVKHNTTKFTDIKNIFQPKDKLSVDFSNGTITLNGTPANSLGAIGNDYFPIQGGDNNITVLKSGFADIPAVTITFREGNL